MNAGTRAITALLFAAVCPASTTAQTVEEFYRSKSITMLIGGGAGGGYDTYARIFARHLSRHIPGNPNIIAKNMPAAAGLAAASTLYTVADKDGSTIAAFTNGAAMDPLFGNVGARYDAQKFNWLGSIGKLQNVCATWHQSEVKTITAARAREVIVDRRRRHLEYRNRSQDVERSYRHQVQGHRRIRHRRGPDAFD
jgi:tripartite-type tricarboxylate transporter receptor subunit TctC